MVLLTEFMQKYFFLIKDVTDLKPSYMPQHNQTMAKKHYYDFYEHRNDQYYHNRLILEHSLKITKIRING